MTAKQFKALKPGDWITKKFSNNPRQIEIKAGNTFILSDGASAVVPGNWRKVAPPKKGKK
jgi:hypothetical protein